MKSILVALALCGLCTSYAAAPPAEMWWMWDRPSGQLPPLSPHAGAALVVTHIILSGDRATRIARRNALPLPPGAFVLPVVHVEIDPGTPFEASIAQRDAIRNAVLDTVAFGRSAWVQLDFEVKKSQRVFWLQAVQSIRASLPAGVQLSVTALASWCHGDRWLETAPVDEIVPMYFRLRSRRTEFERRTKAGAIDPRCTGAYGVADDEPPWPVALPGRRYVFIGRKSARLWSAEKN